MLKKLFEVGLCLAFLFCAANVSHAGDAFLKGGLILHPSENIDVSDRYLIDFGSDYPVSDVLGLGWEVSTAYYSIPFGEQKIHVFPLNGFFNVKLMSPTPGIRPFGKAGIGMIATFFSGALDETVSDLGFHFTGGVEFGSPTGSGVVVELQGQKAFNKDVPFTVILLGGIKF